MANQNPSIHNSNRHRNHEPGHLEEKGCVEGCHLLISFGDPLDLRHYDYCDVQLSYPYRHDIEEIIVASVGLPYRQSMQVIGVAKFKGWQICRS